MCLAVSKPTNIRYNDIAKYFTLLSSWLTTYKARLAVV